MLFQVHMFEEKFSPKTLCGILVSHIIGIWLSHRWHYCNNIKISIVSMNLIGFAVGNIVKGNIDDLLLGTSNVVAVGSKHIDKCVTCSCLIITIQGKIMTWKQQINSLNNFGMASSNWNSIHNLIKITLFLGKLSSIQLIIFCFCVS